MRLFGDRSRSLTPTSLVILILVGPGEAGLVVAGETLEEDAVVEVEDDDRSQNLTLTSLTISTPVGLAEAEVAVAELAVAGEAWGEEEEEEAGEILMKSLTAGEEGAGLQREMLNFFAGSTRVIEAQNAAKQEQGPIENRM